MALDLICGIVALYGAWQGFNRGIIGTFFNLLAYVFGIVVALKVTPFTTEFLESVFSSDNPLMFIAGFLVNIFVVVFILRQAANGIENVLNFAHLGTVNKLLGAALSAALSVLVFSILVWFGVKSHMLSEPLLAGSRTYQPILMPLPAKAKAVAMRLKPLAEEGWNTFTVWLDRVDGYKGDGSSKTTTPKADGTDSERRIYDLPADEGDGIERTTRE
jgi:membrane protein required for colicin V production